MIPQHARRVVVAGLCFLSALVAHAAKAQVPPAEASSGLQAPAQRSTRHTAYGLPAGMWGVDLGMLGATEDEVYGRLAVTRGFRHGIQINCNFLYWSTAILHANARWTFLERPRFAVAAELGILYAHGAWVWVLSDFAQALASDVNLVSVPVSLIASVPVNRWVQFDLTAQYRHGEVFGTLREDKPLTVETQLGVRQLFFRLNAHLYLTSATALELGAKLPAYHGVPIATDTTLDTRSDSYGKQRNAYKDVAFSDGWNFEVGVRSRLQPWLYATLRIQYGQASKQVYGLPVFPSFGVEFRL